jgi:hypothetical protein
MSEMDVSFFLQMGELFFDLFTDMALTRARRFWMSINLYIQLIIKWPEYLFVLQVYLIKEEQKFIFEEGLFSFGVCLF